MPPSERLIGIALALEDALARECWEEADELFAAREGVMTAMPAHAIPREVDDIDARILARLQRGQAEIRREMSNLTQNRRAAVAYAGSSDRGSVASI